jgi:DNA polymerase elongation subunit (family B)
MCLHDNYVVEKDAYTVGDNERYVGAHVFDPIPGVYDGVLPFDFKSLYPTLIIAYNICYSTWVTDPSIPDSMCHVMDWEDHIYCSHDPKMIRKEKLDEYITEQKNKQKKLRETRNAEKNKDKKASLMIEITKITQHMKPFIKERSDIIKGKKIPMCEKRKYRFLKEPRGIIPTLIQNLLDARSNTRKQQGTLLKQIKESDDETFIRDAKVLWGILEQRQLAYKVSGNSMYGAFGVSKGFLPLMPAAMCVTYMGRVSIEKVADMIQKDYRGTLIYGDTDSNYVHFPHIKDDGEAWDYAIHVAKEISNTFPAPMELEFENANYKRFFIITKKRYMYRKCGRDGIVDNEIGTKGVLLARRDGCRFIRGIYEGIMHMIFDKKDSADIIYYVVQRVMSMMSGAEPYLSFSITKEVNSTDSMNITAIDDPTAKQLKGQVGSYKVTMLPKDPKQLQIQLLKKKANTEEEYYLRSLPAHVQLAEKMKSRGYPVDNGTRLEYVLIDIGNINAKQYEKIESFDYFKQFSEILRIDYTTYAKQLVNPIDQIFNVMFVNEQYFKDDIIGRLYKSIKSKRSVMDQIKKMGEHILIFEDKLLLTTKHHEIV